MTRLRRRFVGAALVLCVMGLYSLVATPIAAADEELQQHEDIFIRSDEDFHPANGIVAGTGTKRDPYVITGWQVRRIAISDTSKAIVIRNNDITSQLILNWNGPNVTVVDNKIRDLRVNQNVKRTGAATGGLIADNDIGVVGQLRHFDGIFEENTVRPSRNLFDPISGGTEAVQFDGFNGAIFRNNTLYGALDAKLHGHHHGSSFDEVSHQHSGASSHADGMDHTKRYHEVFIYGNTIHSTGAYALRWTDTNHRGDDRTAASEENTALNAPHSHWTSVHLFENRLVGAGLYVDIFNADDENHTKTNRGMMHIADNVITLERADTEQLFEYRYGIEVWDAKDIDLHITGNKVVSKIEQNLASESWDQFAGISLHYVDVGDIHIADNEVANTYYGIRASQMTETVEWAISGLKTDGVTRDVYYDGSVKNQPRRGP